MAKPIETLSPADEAIFRTATLKSLQGAAEDPNRIGAEYMPDVLEVEYLLPGVETTQAYPEGALTRVGTTLKIHDGVTPGGLIAGGAKNYLHTGGYAAIIPYGVTGSRAKIVTNISTWYWAEIGRVVLPGAMVKDGWNFIFDLNLKFQSPVAVGIANRVGLIVPASIWDVADQATYFGATPSVPSVFGSNTPAILGHRIAASSSLSSTSRVVRTHAMTHDGTTLTIANASAGTYQNGYNYTGAEAWSDTIVSGTTTASVLGDDLEFVLVSAATANAADLREIWYDLTIKAVAP
jgi:hypothetical protein